MRKGFTLLEVLVAGGVLFIVSSAVVGLSNSIIQGTGRNADRTVTNRWATEGLELTSKVRTDSFKAGGTSVATEKIWFAPAANWGDYGWYKLQPPNGAGSNWELEFVRDTVHLPLISIPDMFVGENPLKSQELTAYRLICVEAYGATSADSGTAHVDCNRKPGTTISRMTDGDRTNVSVCQSGDLYCEETQDSLNANQGDGPSKIVPPGNVVKIRSVVVWQDRTAWQTTQLGTVMTNWKGNEQ